MTESSAPSPRRKRPASLSGFIASLIARAVESVPPWLLLETLERVRGLLPG